MRSVPTPPGFRITKIENDRFMTIGPRQAATYSRVFTLFVIRRRNEYRHSRQVFPLTPRRSDEAGILDVLRLVYDKKIGELGSYWFENKYEGNAEGTTVDTPIDYKYAKIELGGVFDFYTDSDGVLKFLQWDSFRFVLDQYLEEDPRVKYHRSRGASLLTRTASSNSSSWSKK